MPKNRSLPSGICIALVLLILLGTTKSFAQSSESQLPESALTTTPFSFSVLSFALDDIKSDSVRTDLYTAIPYDNLSFLYAVDRYVGNYGIAVHITDAVTHAYAGDFFRDYTALETQAQHDHRLSTHSEVADAEQQTLHLLGGHSYEFHIEFHETNTHHVFDTTFTYDAPVFSAPRPTLSDLMICRARHGRAVVPLIGDDVSGLAPSESGLFAEIYNAPKATTLYFYAKVVSDQEPQEAIVQRVIPFRTDSSSRNSIFIPLDFGDVWLGRYSIQLVAIQNAQDTVLKLNDLQQAAIAYRATPIAVGISRGVPLAASDINEAIGELALIATEGEWDSLNRAGTMKEKRNALLEFWRNRKPEDGPVNRPMEIFYRRVLYADRNFGGPHMGWRSDRGRVYIQLGAPTSIDQHPYSTAERPYEIWEYLDLNQRYYFVDQYLLNEYRLVGAPPLHGVFLWRRPG